MAELIYIRDDLPELLGGHSVQWRLAEPDYFNRFTGSYTGHCGGVWYLARKTGRGNFVIRALQG